MKNTNKTIPSVSGATDFRAIMAVAHAAISSAIALSASRVNSIGSVKVIASATATYSGQVARMIRPPTNTSNNHATIPATTPRMILSISSSRLLSVCSLSLPLRFEVAFEQRLFEPRHHSRAGAFGVFAAESVLGPFDDDELSLDVILLERLVNDLAVVDRNEIVLVAVNEQRRRIVRRDVDDGRIIGRFLLLEIQGGEAVEHAARALRVEAARERSKVYRRKIGHDRGHAVALFHEIFFGVRIAVVRRSAEHEGQMSARAASEDSQAIRIDAPLFGVVADEADGASDV